MLGQGISINFCGGCNPQINRLEVAGEVEKLLSGKGFKVSLNSFDANFVIYLSGCSSNCAQKCGKGNLPHIVLAGTSIDGVAVDENQLIREIIKKVANFYGQWRKPDY